MARPVKVADDGHIAEQNMRRRPREFCKYKAGQEGKERQSPQSLDSDAEIGCDCDRDHVPIADRRHRLDAEEEKIGKITGVRNIVPEHVIDCRKKEIGQNIKCYTQGKDGPPRQIHQIDVEIAEQKFLMAFADNLRILAAGYQAAIQAGCGMRFQLKIPCLRNHKSTIV